MTTTDTCPIHSTPQALTWCIREGVTMNTYGHVVRVIHRASRRTHVQVLCAGKDEGAVFVECVRALWLKVEQFKRVKA
jgi:hypothetical protein